MQSLSNQKPDKYGIKTIFHAVMGVVILIVGSFLASLPVDLFFLITKLQSSLLSIVIRPILTILVVSSLLYLYIVKILKKPASDFRICRPKNIIVWILCAVALPLCVSAFFICFVPGTFAASGLNPEQIIQRILNAVLNTCLVAGITEELLFRGFIMRLLEVRWNKSIAILAPSVLFGLLHIFNLERFNFMDMAVLLIAGTSVGIMFSMIAYQSGSIWASAAVHGLWNLIIIGRILEIGIDPGKSIFTYQLSTNSLLLTGGAFGIEASLPAIIGYGLVIILACTLCSKNAVKRK